MGTLLDFSLSTLLGFSLTRLILRWTDARVPPLCCRVPDMYFARLEGARLAGTANLRGAPDRNTPSGAALMGIAEGQAAGQVGEADARAAHARVGRAAREARQAAAAAAAGTPDSNNASLREGTDIIKNNLRDAGAR